MPSDLTALAPLAPQTQIFGEKPKWMEAVLNGEHVSAEDMEAAKTEGEECSIM
eukprot:SAG11_NODE_25205_length_362_cov_0.775665_2_plen_53_part_00